MSDLPHLLNVEQPVAITKAGVGLDTGNAGETKRVRVGDMKFEFVVIPVSDVDRAKDFYSAIGWTLDMDFVRGDNYRVIQFTPPGSQCSIIFGSGLTGENPGSARKLYLVVSDIERTRAELQSKGVVVSDIFHDEGGVFHHAGEVGRVTGVAPQRRSYGSFAQFGDPDGNEWFLQEVTVRLPGHGSVNEATFSSSLELAGALQRARSAFDHQREGMGLTYPDWTTWIADYVVLEQAGRALPG